MELRDYIRIITKQWPLVAIITIVLAAGSYFYTARQPASVDGSVTFTVVNSERFPKDQYGYDYYFTIQASALLGETVAGWFGSPGFVAKIYNDAHVAMPVSTTRAAGRLFRPNKDTEHSTVVNVSVKTDKRNETENLIKSAAKMVTTEVESLKAAGKIAPTFSIVTTEPLILEDKAKPAINGAIALLVGIILGSLVAVGRQYFKES